MTETIDLSQYQSWFREHVARKPVAGPTSDIVTLTASYERWARQQLRNNGLPLISKDIALKHEHMAQSEFLFLRATFYAWITRMLALCPEILDAPVVLSVGDMNADNFGSWRDLSEAWLNWGCNDFDEAYPLPYTSDLVRLAASIKLAIREEGLRMRPRDAYSAILEGYTSTLRKGGEPFILAEHNVHLRKMIVSEQRSPDAFWAKFEDQFRSGGCVPRPVMAMLAEKLPAFERQTPDVQLKCKFGRRTAGEGSLGRPRFVALAEFNGSRLAREAKAVLPSACVWAGVRVNRVRKPMFYTTILDRVLRLRDPFMSVEGNYVVRRISPDNSRVELADISGRHRDEHLLLHCMGAEVANVHLGTPGARSAILADLKKRPREWLRMAAKKMAAITCADQEVWSKYYNDR